MTRSASRAIPSCTIRIGWLIKRRPGRPANHVVRRYTGFHYRAGSRSKARQVVARVAFHMTGTAAAGVSVRSAAAGKGVTGAGQHRVPRRVAPPMARFAGMTSANMPAV